MAILFQKGSLSEKVKNSVKMAWAHGKNLGLYVFIYKLVQCALRQSFRKDHPLFAFAAGICGAIVIWRERNAINQQICFYLLSRILEGCAKRVQKQTGYGKNLNVFSYLSVICWGIVMFLFEEDRSVL
eukprot:CAMPEP_0202963358 /NCGR_PEP_ID=MMETSP1396-20130829/7350_1 /ASSEMBLY_ACC=CAM_ASM_000872 /TAXON_ID= /ORGANISM="Pseudokeronopsis sp., Strain Brazil" /LENGTH=127 /DNA_ID=CAMNT_0049684503 /DNA_START=248 /DNA_END=631 /DNA_ORIENTATION=+